MNVKGLGLGENMRSSINEQDVLYFYDIMRVSRTQVQYSTVL
jgi:hypothetical protein